MRLQIYTFETRGSLRQVASHNNLWGRYFGRIYKRSYIVPSNDPQVTARWDSPGEWERLVTKHFDILECKVFLMTVH